MTLFENRFPRLRSQSPDKNGYGNLGSLDSSVLLGKCECDLIWGPEYLLASRGKEAGYGRSGIVVGARVLFSFLMLQPSTEML